MSYQFSVERELTDYRNFKAIPASGALGAYIEDINLNDLSDDAFVELKEAFLEFKVLFFREQPMTEEQHVAFARRWGMPQGPGAVPQVEGYPQIKDQQFDELSSIGSDVNYHSDDTFRDYPSKLSILRALATPPGAGNTIWCDMEKAYDALSQPLKDMIDGLDCVHDLDKTFGKVILEGAGAKGWEDMMKRNPPATHPVAPVHAETGRKCIYPSKLTGKYITQLSDEESQWLLDFLMQHSYRPEFEVRMGWEKDTIAMWDNRCLQHRGINDFSPAFRHMQRVAIIDELRPDRHPETQKPLAFDPTLDYVPVADLYSPENKPEMTYGKRTTDEVTDDKVVVKENGEDDNTPVDQKFWDKINSTREGVTFTSGAAASVKKIPGMFRGMALKSIFKEAKAQGKTQIDVAVLQAVNEQRQAG